MKLGFGLAAWAILCCSASAQEAVTAEPSPAPVAETLGANPPTPPTEPQAPVPEALPAGHGLVAKNTVVIIQVAETLSSKTAKVGDKFRIQLAEPIVTAEGVLVPAGASGVGEVVSASKAGAMAKAGELVLAARYIEHNGQTIRLKAFKLGVAGKNNSTSVGVAMLVAPLPIAVALLAVPGGNVDVPAGSLANAKLAADLIMPIQASPTIAAAAPTPDSVPSAQ